MRLEKASYKAVKYACMNFHYSKTTPMFHHSYSVFNDNGDWCGVVVYTRGATPAIASPFGLNQGQVIELQRVALNGKQESTSQALGISLRLLKKDLPLVKLLVSYADETQGHKGVIYQACNWFFVGDTARAKMFIHKASGKPIHSRKISSKAKGVNEYGRNYSKDEVTVVQQKEKHKYIYPLDKSLIQMCKGLAKPYPKKQAAEVLPVAQQASSQQERFDSILPLNISNA